MCRDDRASRLRRVQLAALGLTARRSASRRRRSTIWSPSPRNPEKCSTHLAMAVTFAGLAAFRSVRAAESLNRGWNADQVHKDSVVVSTCRYDRCNDHALIACNASTVCILSGLAS